MEFVHRFPRSAPRFHLAELEKDQQSKVKLTSSNMSADSDRSVSLVRAQGTSWLAKTHSLSVVLINRKIPFPKRFLGRKRSCRDLFSKSCSTSTTGCSTTSRQTVVCHVCSRADQEGKLKSATKDAVFISSGFKNWKDALEAFR